MPLLEEASPGASASESHYVFPSLPWKRSSVARLKVKEACRQFSKYLRWKKANSAPQRKKSTPLESSTVSETPVDAVDVVNAFIEQNPGNKIEVSVKTSGVERAPSTASKSRRIRFGRGGSWHSTREHKDSRRSDSSATDTIVTKHKVAIEEISKAALLGKGHL